MLVDFDIMPDESRTWVYASEHRLTNKQQDYILKSIYDHLKGWEAHNIPLTAGVKIIENHFIIVALDGSKNEASGCSIDTIQNKIQQIESKLSISLLNRLNIFCIIDYAIVCIPSINLRKNVNKDTLFYDLTIESKSQIHSFLKPISDGWCAKLVD